MNRRADSIDTNAASKHANMSVPEKWEWHARVYAHRRLVLGIGADVRTSPCDESGIWFHESMVEDAESKLRERLIHVPRRAIVAEKRRADRNFLTYYDIAAAGRRIANEWAQQRGHDSFRDYVASRGLIFDDDYDYALACTDVAASIIAAGAKMNTEKFREERGKYRDRYEAAQSLRENGITAREYDPEALRAGRIALGLEKATEQVGAAE